MKQERIDLMVAMVLRTRDDLDLIARKMISKNDLFFAERALKYTIDCRLILSDILNEALESDH